MFNRSALSVLKALPGKLDIKDTHLVLTNYMAQAPEISLFMRSKNSRMLQYLNQKSIQIKYKYK